MEKMDTHTDTQDNYCNPPRACTPKVKYIRSPKLYEHYNGSHTCRHRYQLPLTSIRQTFETKIIIKHETEDDTCKLSVQVRLKLS